MRQPIAQWNPTLMLWETENLSLFSERLEPYSATFPTSGMTRNGALFPLPASAHPTAGSECSLLPGLPTPRATDWKDMMQAPASIAHAEAGKGTLSEVLGLHMLLTPRATDGTKGGPNRRGSSGDLMLPSAVMDL